MFRGNNVSALRTGFRNNNMAMRVSACACANWSGGIRGVFGQRALSISQSAAPRRIGSSMNTRKYSTEHGPSDLDTLNNDTSPKETPDAPETPRHTNDAATDPLLDIAAAGTSLKARGRADLTSRVNRKVVEMEIKWLQDPRALADRVARLLGAGNVALAAALVREAQKERMECSVAWNRLLEYCMENGRALAAFKFYNEMKKRGRRPTSRTYTIMLDGLSQTGRDSGLNPVKVALGIYRSISAPNSFVEQNIIHGNAMLKVCCYHTDLETLWQVAGELPEDGPNSPDPTTYSIILRAIYDAAQKDLAAERAPDTDRAFARRAQSVVEGKRIWADVVYRWRKGQMELDNRLVSAMAKVLQGGSTDRDCYDVFALLHQTAGIPILAKTPPTEIRERRAAGSRLQSRGSHEREEVEDVPFVDDGEQLYRPRAISKPEEEEEEENFDDLFNPVVPEGLSAPENGKNAQVPGPKHIPVGNRELTLILQTCMEMTQALGAGKGYWQHLTQEDHPYKVEPDMGAFHEYLRLLRLARSSRLAAEVVRDQMVPAKVISGTSFHIALSSCRRDRKNMNVLKHANELIRLMGEALVLPDSRVLEGYLDLIRTLERNPQSLVTLNGLDTENKASKKLGNLGRELQIALQKVAVEQLRPHVTKLATALEHGQVVPIGRRLPRNILQHAVDGSLSVKVLIQYRGLMDNILKPEHATSVSKDERKALEHESRELRKYSKSELEKKYAKKLVAPTPDQILEFKDRENAGAAPAGVAPVDAAPEVD